MLAVSGRKLESTLRSRKNSINNNSLFLSPVLTEILQGNRDSTCRSSEKATMDLPSLLTGNPSDAWATSFTEAAKEWEAQRVASVPPASSAGSTTSASHRPSGRAALLEVERLSMIPSKSEARHLPETGEAIRCSLPRSCMHASSHELASRLAVHRPRTFETDLKTERGCTMDACEVM